MGASIDTLRARIRAIEGGGLEFGREVAQLDPRFDAQLPWAGLPYRALHEVSGPAAAAMAAIFARAFLARPGALVWCLDDGTIGRRGLPYGPGLAAFGIPADRLLLIRTPDPHATLWAFEEALRCPAVACAMADLERLDLVTSRRLQLAAEAGGGAGVVLRGAMVDLTPNAALTRFLARPLLPDPEQVATVRAMRLDLWRVKGGAPVSWRMSFDDATLAFAVAPGLADRADGAGTAPKGAAAAAR
jgi:protein ImuA